MKIVLSVALAASVAISFLPAAGGQTLTENPVHICQDYDVNLFVDRCRGALVADDLDGFFASLQKALDIRRKRGDFCVPEAGGVFRKVDEVLLGLLSRMPDERLRFELRARNVDISPLLGAPAGMGRFLEGLSIAEACEAEADRLLEAGRFRDALRRLDLRGRLRPAAGGDLRLKEAWCRAKLGHWARVRNLLKAHDPGSDSGPWTVLRRAAATPDRLPAVFAPPPPGPCEDPLPPGTPRLALDLPFQDADPSALRYHAGRGVFVNTTDLARDRDRIFVGGLSFLCAYSASTGDLLWQFPEFPPAPTGLDHSRHRARLRRVGSLLVVTARGRLRAFDARSGKLLWSLGRRDKAGGEEKGEFDDTAAFSPPAVHRGILYTAWVKGGESGELRLLGIRPDGTAVLRIFLCSVKSYAEFGYAPRPCLALAGDTLFVQTDLGALFALDLATQRILWAATYPRSAVAPRNVLQRAGETRPSPPLPGRIHVVFSPSDSPFVLALDRATGGPGWRVPRDGAQVLERPGHRSLVLVGRELRVVDRATGTVEGILPLPRPAAGRACVGPERALVPTQDAVVSVPLSGGPPLRSVRLPSAAPFDLHLAESGTVAVSLGKLLFLNPRDLSLASARKDGEGSDPATWLGAARRLEDLGRPAEAELLYRKFLGKAGDGDPILAHAARERLALILQVRLRQGKEGPEAVALAEELAGLSPDRGAEALLALARHKVRTGDAVRALPILKKVLSRFHREEVQSPYPREAGDAAREMAAEIARQGEISEALERGAKALWEELSKAHGGARAADFTLVEDLYPGTSWAERALGRRAGLLGREGRELDRMALTLRGALDRAWHRSGPWAGHAARLARRRGWPVLAHHWTRLFLARLRQALAPEAAPFPPPREMGGWGADAVVLNVSAPPFQRTWHLTGVPEEEEAAPLRPLGFGPGLGQTVFIGTKNTLWCVDGRSGAVLWMRHTGPRRGGTAWTAGRLVYALPGGFAAVRPLTGETDWSFRFEKIAAPDEILLFPLGDRIVGAVPLASGLVDVLCLRAMDGELLWRKKMGGKAPLGWVGARGRPGFVLYAADGARVRFDLASGDLTPRRSILLELGLTRGTVSAWPGARGRTLGSVREPRSGRTQLWAADPESGAIAWRREIRDATLVVSSPGFDGFLVGSRAPEGNPRLAWISGRDGKALWERGLEGWRLASGELHPAEVAVLRGRSPLGDTIIAVSLRDGTTLWQMSVDRDRRLALSLAWAAVSNFDGEVELKDIRTGEERGRTPAGFRDIQDLYALPGDLWMVRTAVGIDFYRSASAEGVASDRFFSGESGWKAGLDPARALIRGTRWTEGLEALAGGTASDETVPYDFWSPALFNLRGLWEGAAWESRPEIVAWRREGPAEMNGTLDEEWAPHAAVDMVAPKHLDFVRGHAGPRPLWRGPYDLSGRLYTAWDEAFFYVVLDLTDQIRIQSDGTKFTLNGDIIYKAFDLIGDGGTSMGRDDVLLISASWKKGTSPFRDRPRGKLKQGNQQIRPRGDSTGLVLESRIPWAFFNDQLTERGLRAHLLRPRPGMRFGFNIAVVDDDGRGAKTVLRLSPGLNFGRDDRPGYLDFFRRGPYNLLVRRFHPGLFAEVVLK
jgi:outer membrane protein assembly factor BamB